MCFGAAAYNTPGAGGAWGRMESQIDTETAWAINHAPVSPFCERLPHLYLIAFHYIYVQPPVVDDEGLVCVSRPHPHPLDSGPLANFHAFLGLPFQAHTPRRCRSWSLYRPR